MARYILLDNVLRDRSLFFSVLFSSMLVSSQECFKEGCQ